MTIYYLAEMMGSGKTLFATFYALAFNEQNPDSKIYANYKIRLPKIKKGKKSINNPNFIYTKYLVLPLSEIIKAERSLIIVDDCKVLRNLNYFIEIVSSMSRKAGIDVIITGQYYTMVKKELRTLADYQVKVNYLKKRDVLEVVLIDLNNRNHYFTVRDIVKKVGKLYNTNEIVHIPNDRKINHEIKKFCYTLDDLESNLSLFYKDKRTYDRYLRILRKKSNIEVMEDIESEENKFPASRRSDYDTILPIVLNLKDEHGISFYKISDIVNVPRTTIQQWYHSAKQN